MRIKFTVDSRDYHAYKQFGQVTDLDKAVNFDDPSIPEKVQPLGNVQCVLYTGTYLAQNLTKKEYDIDELWSRVPSSPDGTDPRDVFKEIVKNGLKIKGTNTYDKPFSSYWRADTGPLDAFDNTRSTMALIQSPVAIGSFWYEEWLNLGPAAVMPIGVRPVSGHMYADKGWHLGSITPTYVNGEPMFIIEWWGGYTMYMPRATFNAALKPLGMQTWVLSTVQMDTLKTKTMLETIKDLLINLLILLRNRFNKTTTPTPSEPVLPPQTPASVDKYSIEIFCKAIQDFEGYTPNSRSYKNKSPGNVRYSPVGYLPEYGLVQKDPQGFAIFPTYALGWLYLRNLVKEFAGKHPDWTITQFCSVYAPTSDNNDPIGYANFIARRLDVDVKQFTLKQLT